MSKGRERKTDSNFDTISVTDVPKGRKGKHHTLIGAIVTDLEHLQPGTALKVPFTKFHGARLANVRAALNRVTRARDLDVNTSTDQEALYVWKSGKRQNSR